MDNDEAQEQEWDWLIRGLREGDNSAVATFMEKFGTSLERIAAGRISPQMAKRFGPQSVALSVCRTFVRRSGEGLFELEDGEAMWRLLCAITLTKVREKVRFHRREKRNIDRETQPKQCPDGPAAEEFQFRAATPGPDQELEFADTLEHLIMNLDEEERRLLELKTQNLENDEIADAFGCSERTVRRMLGRLCTKFESELELS